MYYPPTAWYFMICVCVYIVYRYIYIVYKYIYIYIYTVNVYYVYMACGLLLKCECLKIIYEYRPMRAATMWRLNGCVPELMVREILDGLCSSCLVHPYPCGRVPIFNTSALCITATLYTLYCTLNEIMRLFLGGNCVVIG